jgi:hypothetical protein
MSLGGMIIIALGIMHDGHALHDPVAEFPSG